ncbi:Microtubule-associated protein, microtubule dynamics during spindle orientation [Chytridiales sp. JEL 0842]|nr:Microtubule-associated protein, microtubule dynamics during spindle orientation [Chytridiales sp. JEL 0842]
MADAAEEDFSSLPLTERLVHKSWKARQGAYEELTKLFKTLPLDADNEYKKWQDYLKKMVTDANLVAQEAGVGAVLAYAENAPSGAKTRNVIAPMVVEKCLGSTRTGTKLKGMEVLMMYIEVENKGDGVVEDILPGLDHKTPKNVVAAVTTLKEAVRLFGVKVVPVKPLLKVLPKIFDHKDKNVRSEGTALAVELYRWLGPALTPSLNELKPVQLKELNEMFESLPPGRAAAERFVRSEQAKREDPSYLNDAAAGADNAVPEAEPEPIDPFDISDPVNVLDKLPAKFYDELASTKWKERKEILEALLALVKFPKLEDGRYGELINSLGKRINDANILVVGLAVNCIEHIARGLRSNFSQYKGIVISPLLEKLKEKKQAVIDAIREALDAVFLSTTLPEVMEDISGASAHKNPQVRAETLQWLIRCLKRAKKAPAKGEIKTLCEMLLKALDDGDSNVREAAAEALGSLMKIVTERAMAMYIEKLDKVKEAKVREYFEKAEVRAGGGGAGAKKPMASAGVRPATADKENQPPRGAIELPKSSRASVIPPKPAPKKKPALAVSASSSAPSSASAPVPKKKAAPQEDQPVIFKYTPESAKDWMAEAFPEVNLGELSDSNWKTRLAVAHALLEAISNKPPADIQAEAVICLLGTTPGWKESNFQVMTAVVNIFTKVAKSPSCNRAAASIAVAGLAEKLGDMKVKKVAGECLEAMSESVSLQFVLSQLYEPLKKAKSPKILSDAITWMYQTLMEFGIKGLAVRDLVDFVKLALGNTNQAVRNAGVMVLSALRIFVGPDIRTFVTDLNPQLLATIDAEFEKVANREAPQPTRAQTQTEESASADPTEDLFPRVDISTQITPTLIDKLGDANWKIRKEGLDEVAAIIESTNKRMKSNLGDLIPALKARLSDANKNLAMNTVEIVGNLAIAVGKPFDRHAKQILSPMATLLGDQKVHIRTAALTALENVFSATGIEPFVYAASQTLMTDQPQMRKDFLKFLADKMEINKSAGGTLPDLHSWIHPILLCLQDKNADVRKFAAMLLVFLAESVGIDHVHEKAEELFKGAALASLTPFFEQVRSANRGGAATSASAPSSRPLVPGTPSKLKRAGSTVSGAGDAPITKSRPVSAAVGAKPKVRSTISSGSLSLKKEDSAASLGNDASLFPVLTSDMRAKETRAGQDRGLTKWTFETPRRELIDFLAEQCEGNLSPGCINLLFSTDHYKEKDFLSALTMLDEGCVSATNGEDDLKARYIANSDLILKYISIRLFDTNTSMLIKVLELLDHLFNLFDQEAAQLTEYEASAFLPFFVNKVGDNKETMRVKIREIFKQLCRVYPSSKLFTYLLDALKSKNSRTRSECLEELADLIKRNGMTVCNPSKAFPVIAAQIADSDAKVRNAALGVVTQAYVLVGDVVYKYLGKISEKDKSLLEEKVKRLPASSRIPSADIAAPSARATASRGSIQETSAKEGGMVGMPKKASASVYSSVSGLGGIKKEFSLDLDKVNAQASRLKATEGTASPLRGASPVSGSTFSGGVLTSSGSESNLMMDYIVAQITSTDAYQSIDALKQLERMLSSNYESVSSHVDEIVSAITLQVRIAFTAADLTSPGTGRLCKHLVNVLVQTFSIPDLAKTLSRDSVFHCMQEVLHRLLDPNLQSIDQGSQLARALNVLMVRILENTNRNLSFDILLSILQLSTSATVDATVTAPDQVPVHAKYTELVMKCLWKMTKVIPQVLSQKLLDVSALLFAVHKFLEAMPPSDWKRRAVEKVIPQADMPLRTVKTILHEIVNVLGESVYSHLTLIAEPQRSHAVVYIKQMVDQEKRKMMVGGSEESVASSNATESTDSLREHASNSRLLQQRPQSVIPSALGGQGGTQQLAGLVGSSEGSNAHQRLQQQQQYRPPSSVGSIMTVADADARLTVIFARIGQKDETKQGIADLYEFRKAYPEYEERVQAHLSKTGNYFQGYIKRGLASLETEEANRQSGGSGMSSLGLPSSGLSSARYSPETVMDAAPKIPSVSSILGSNSTSSTSFSRGLSGAAPTTMSSASSMSAGANLNHGASGSAAGSGDSLDSYKETLSRLQHRLGLSENGGVGVAGGSPTKDRASPTGLYSSTSMPASAGVSAPSTTKFAGFQRTSPGTEGSEAATAATQRPTSTSSGGAPTQTVEQLKQRLARMKMSMNTVE